MGELIKLDLGVGDVHSASAGAPDKRAKRRADRKKKLAATPPPAPGEETPLKRRSIHVRADLAPGGSLHVRHLADGVTEVYLPPLVIPADAV